MSTSSTPSQDSKEEARRALRMLSRDEQRDLMDELELHKSDIFFGPFAGVSLGMLTARADPRTRMMILAVFGLVIILFLMAVAVTVMAIGGKPVPEQFFAIITTIIGYLAGVVTPKPGTSQKKEEDKHS